MAYRNYKSHLLRRRAGFLFSTRAIKCKYITDPLFIVAALSTPSEKKLTLCALCVSV